MKWISEIGKTGLVWSYGYIYEEFILKLRGSQGVKTYREMMDNDAIIGACLFAIEQILREARWSVKPAGETQRNKQHAGFLEENMLGMSHSWNDFVTEILSMVPYGWSYFETVYKRRSKDNMIVWKKIPIRLQSSLDHWNMEANGDVKGMFQRPAPDYKLYYLPLAKCLLFRTKLAGGNPEGKSVLRPAFRAWYFKKNIEEIEGIGIERDLAGLPVLTPPENFDIDSDEPKVKDALSWAKKLIANIRRDEQDGVIKPHGWELELLSSPGKRQFDTTDIINRYNKAIAITVLAQFIMLGMERTGSYALAKEQTDMFYLCLEGWLNSIVSVCNRYAVPRLFAMNGVRDEPLPQIVHTSVHRYGLKDLAEYVNKLAGIEALVVDDDLRDYLKKNARLSEFSEVRK